MAFTDYIPLVGEAIDIGNMISQGVQNKKNRQFQEKMWNKTNEYNTPLNQVKRMKEGGLNPALMYQGAPQNVAQQSKVPEGVAPHADPELLTNIMSKMAQTGLTNENAAIAQTKQELMLSTIQKINVDMENIKSEINKRDNFDIPKVTADIANVNANTANTTQQTINAGIMADKLTQEIATMKQQFGQSSELFPISKQHAENENRKQLQEILQIKQQINAFPPMQQALLKEIAAKITNLGKDATTKDYENTFRSYEDALRKANVNPTGNFIETLIKWTAIFGGRVSETVLGGRNPYNNQNK